MCWRAKRNTHGRPAAADVGDWGKRGLRARGRRTLLMVRASAHERVRAKVVTGVTPEVGLTWRVARVYVFAGLSHA